MTDRAESFEAEIAANQAVESVPKLEVVSLRTPLSYLAIRRRGLFIIDCALDSPSLKEPIDVLYSTPNPSVPKLIASHIMSPVGPTDGIGGRHGFARWADYKDFPLVNGPAGESRMAFQAKRPDNGLAVSKVFELAASSLVGHTTVYNPGDRPDETSIGEHYYFTLAGEKFEGLKVDGNTLDELLGEGAEGDVINGTPLFWPSFDGAATIDFPAGHTVELRASVTGGNSDANLGMLVWHRTGTGSICFEPTVGFDESGSNTGLVVESYRGATLSTKIELL